jgi:hypothetical protein
VERAREYLEGKAGIAAKCLVTAMKAQAARGDASAAQWLLQHIASTDATGKMIRPIAVGVDRPVAFDPAASAPRIMIGVGLGADFAAVASRQQLGDLPTVRELPAGDENV